MNVMMHNNYNLYFQEVTWVVTIFSNAHAESLTSHYLHLLHSHSTKIPFPRDFTNDSRKTNGLLLKLIMFV